MPRPKSYVAAWLDPEFGREIETLAVSMGIGKSELLRLALRQFVINQSGSKAPEKESA